MSNQNPIKSNALNPFPGLRAFNDSESHLFFGREDHIADVRKKLEANHFVAVVGTSGTGKSSLIRAGVLPNLLSEKDDAGNAVWELVTITPGNAPLENLARGIAGISNEKQSQDARYKAVLELIKGSSLGLVQAMRGNLKPGSRLLILVDQFEEVFRFSDEDSVVSKDEYTQFVQILIDTMRQRDVPIYTILTLRSDFLGDCVRFEGLPESINDGHYLVPRMRKRQVNRVITGPVEYVEGKISPRLIQDIIKNMGDDSDQLPILQHALMRTFDVWQKANISGEPMDVKHLEAVGGLGQALSKHADEAFSELDAQGKLRAAKVFKCLTVKKGDNRGVRRPMTLQSLTEICQSSESEILTCLEPFRAQGRTFILPGLDQKASAETIFDISHESLMRGWERLRTWTDEEMESAAMFERIAEAADLHQKGATALWRDPELQLAIDWKNKQTPIEAWGDLYHDDFQVAMDFIADSKFQATAEKQKEKKRRTLVRSSIAVFLIVVSGLSGWALFQTDIANEKSMEALAKSEEAVQEKERAENEKERAEAERANAISASEEAAMARDDAQAQAEIAENQSQRADAERANAESAASLAIAEQNRAIEQENIANQRSQEVLLEKQKADSARDEATRLRMISLSQNLAYESSQIQNNPELAALLAIESYDLAAANGGNTNTQSIYSAATQALKNVDNTYNPIAVTTSKKTIAIAATKGSIGMVDEQGALKIFNSNNFALRDETQTGLSPEQISTAYISPEVNRFVLGLKNNQVLGYTPGSKNPAVSLDGHEGLLRGVSFQDGFEGLITAGRDGNLIVWKNGAIHNEMSFGARINTLSYNAHSDVVFVGCADGHSYKYSISKNTKDSFKERTSVRVEVIAQSANGKHIAIGYSDGLTQVFTNSGRLIKSLPGIGAVNFIAINPGQDMLALTTTNKRLSIYKLSNLTILPVEVKVDRPITAVTYDSNQQRIYIACSNRACYQYSIHAKTYIARLQSKVNRGLTAEEWATFIGEDVPYKNQSN